MSQSEKSLTPVATRYIVQLSMKQDVANPTIDHIAAQANLSRSSVAKILRGRPGYNENTRRRVMQIAQKLNYRPNYLSKALAGGKSMTIGLLAPTLKAPSAVAKVRAVEEKAAEAGYLAYLATPHIKNASRLIRCLNNMVERRVDGILLHAPVRLPNSAVETIASMRIPVVVMDQSQPGIKHYVQVSRLPGIVQLAEHLAALGHRSAAMICTPSSQAYPELKSKPYRESFGRAGISCHKDNMFQLDPKIGFKAHSYRIVSHLLKRADRPSVLVMNNDDCAHAAMAACCDAGVRVPADISVVGFDDLPHVQYLRPALTTVHQPREEVGVHGMQMLLKLMRDPGAVVEPVVLPCRLVVRETTGPAPRS